MSLSAYAQALRDKITLSIADFAAQYYAAEGVAGLVPLFAAAHRAGQAVYLLDGLDEVASDWRGAVADRVVALAHTLGPNPHVKRSGWGTGEWLANYIGDFSIANRLVATSRITGYIPLGLNAYRPGGLAGYSEATLESLNTEQISEFVHKWYAIFFEQRGQVGQADKTVAGLLRMIHDNRGVGKLADNPLTLTMLALLYFAGGADLPRQRVRLYGQVARTLIEDWRKARSLAGMPVGTTHEELEVLKRVGPLAYWLHDTKPEGLATRAEIEHQLVQVERKDHPDEEHDFLGEVRRFLDNLQSAVGLLSEKGMGQWGFTHLTFEEYFAAREIARWRQSRVEAEIARRAPDPRWTEVIRLAIAYIGTESGRTEDATALVEETILGHADPYEPYLHRNLLLAGRVVADDPGVERRVGARVARQLFDLYVETPIDGLKENAGAVLLEMLDSSVQMVLIQAVAAEVEGKRWVEGFGLFVADAPLREALLRLLADPTKPAVRETLVALLVVPNAVVRAAAIRTLGRAASDPIVREAVLPLLADPDREVRQAVVEALGRAVSDPIVRTSLGPLLTDSDPYVRGSIARALGNTDNASTMREALLPLLTDPERFVRRAAVEALGGATNDPAVRAALLPLLTDPEPDMRLSAARALGHAVTDPIVCAALFPLRGDADMDVCICVIRALGNAVSNPTVREALLVLLTDPESDIRSSAAEALGGAVHDPVVRVALLPWLADADPFVREPIAKALGSPASDPAVCTALLHALAHPPNRQAAALALCTVASDLAVRDALLPLLTDPDGNVRWAAVRALGNTASDPTVRDALLPLLADPEWYMRSFTAEALGRIASDPALRTTLLSLLANAEKGVRPFAARILGNATSDPLVCAALLPLSTDSDPTMRQVAARALVNSVSAPAVREALLPLLADPESGVRWAAVETLSNATSDPLVCAALLPLLTDPEERVRSSAVRALGNTAYATAVRTAILPLLTDPESSVRQDAAQALRDALPDAAGREVLAGLLDDSISEFDTEAGRVIDVAAAAFSTLTRWAEVEYEAEKRTWPAPP